MIVDTHVHVLPHAGGAAGYKDAETHLRMQQDKIQRFWGRMVTSTLDPRYIPLPGEDVGFRIGRYGRYYWTKQGRECWLQRFPTIMIEMEWPPEQMIAFMDSVGVDVAVLQTGYMEINFNRQYYADCLRRWPDRFVGCITIDYDIERDERYREAELDKLREAVAAHRIRAVLEQRKGQKVDDHRFDPLWKELSRLQLPHFFSTGFQPSAEYLDALRRIEIVLRRFPGLRGILYHLGGNVRPSNDSNRKRSWRSAAARLPVSCRAFQALSR